MKDIKPALILYIISGFLFFLSTIIENEQLSLITKPMISTSMLFYYWQSCKGKINFWFTTILILFFISGVLNLFDDAFVLKYVIITNLISYTILLSFIVRSLLELKLKLLDNINLTYIVLMFLFLCCLLYVCLFLIFDSNSELYQLIILYGFVLLIIGISNTILCSLDYNKANIYLMVTTFCYIICDLFYSLYYYYYDFIFFRYVSILCNILSFYFLVNYFLQKNEIGYTNDRKVSDNDLIK
jgi:hypothetical protein